MGVLDHGGSREDKPEQHPSITSRNSRYGRMLFLVYLLIYGAFVLTNAFAPELMDRTPVLGVSLSIIAGFGLIVAAFLLALVYGWLCRDRSAAKLQDGDSAR